MAFLIRSDDGRVRICTASAEAARQHAIRLKQDGVAFKVTDFNGASLDFTSLVGLPDRHLGRRIKARRAA